MLAHYDTDMPDCMMLLQPVAIGIDLIVQACYCTYMQVDDITVPKLIAPHAPNGLPTGDQTGVCYICATETDHGQRRAPSDAFTAWAACAVGDVLCPSCAATLGWRDVRMFPWLATPDGVRFVGRGDRGWMWDVLIDPPEPPFAIYITQGGQKQGW